MQPQVNRAVEQTTFFDDAVLESLAPDEFRARQPFRWHCFEGALTPDAFAQLHANYPSRDLFEWRAGVSGQFYSRPQDRWFLEYRPGEPSAPGSAQKADLPEVWQRFIDEIETNARYRALVSEWLDLDVYELRLTWHMGVTGSEVSAHLDTDKKLGTHIWYFNTAEDWDPAWGGNLLVLSSDSAATDLDFSELSQVAEVDTLGNKSFLFKNSHDAWHGVPPLTCPEGRYRRLFNVVYERPEVQPPSLMKRLQKRFARPLHR